MSTYEGTDRYEALGMSYPDPETMCAGQCEGTGAYPVKGSDGELSDEEIARWYNIHTAPNAHTGAICDGWHFITCPDCEGTGKKAA